MSVHPLLEFITKEFLQAARNCPNQAAYNTFSDNSLNFILRIKLRGNSVTEFNNMYLDSVLKHWYNQKSKKEICEKIACVF